MKNVFGIVTTMAIASIATKIAYHIGHNKGIAEGYSEGWEDGYECVADRIERHLTGNKSNVTEESD